MVTLDEYEWADLIDTADKVKMLADPTSQYAQTAAFAIGRSMDDVIITAATGTAKQVKQVLLVLRSLQVIKSHMVQPI